MINQNKIKNRILSVLMDDQKSHYDRKSPILSTILFWGKSIKLYAHKSFWTDLNSSYQCDHRPRIWKKRNRHQKDLTIWEKISNIFWAVSKVKSDCWENMDGPCMMDRPVSGLLLFRQVENKQEYLQPKQYFFKS